MKRVILLLSMLYVGLACSISSAPAIGSPAFPLQQAALVPIDAPVRGITVARTWIAVDTLGAITALDIDSQRELWTLPFHTPTFARSFLALDDTLIAASRDRVLLIDRTGAQKALDVGERKVSIIALVAAYPDYLYLIQGGQWTLEAYSLRENRLLWTAVVGRGGADEAFYDPSKGVVYVTGGSIKAFDNKTGRLLWQESRDTLHATFEDGVIYEYEKGDAANRYRVSAFDPAAREEIWNRNYYFTDALGVEAMSIVDDRLMLCGGTLIALEKRTGRELWTVDVGERFYSCPVQYRGTLYVMDGTSETVFAISPKDGVVIGHVRLETRPFYEGADADAAVYLLQKGIVFNTRSALAIYR